MPLTSWLRKLIIWGRSILNHVLRLISLGRYGSDRSRRSVQPLDPPTAAQKTPSPKTQVAAALYQPLRQDKADNGIQEIRLLSIETLPTAGHASGQPSMISCTLRTCSVAAAQQGGYFALSYVWGDAQDTQPILVNGLTFLATRNLIEALRHVCAVKPECRSGLWVDAVCINQLDDGEKSSQVALMRHIYVGARETLAWLGLGDAESRAAMRLVNRIWEDDDVMGRGGKPPQPERLAVPDVCDLIEDLGDATLFFSDVFDQRPYWTRIWTIQEAILGESCRLIAGTDSCFFHATIDIMEWAMSDKLYEFLELIPDDGDEALLTVVDMVREIQDTAEMNTKITLLRTIKRLANRLGLARSYSDVDRALLCFHAAAHRTAMDPRDMIFGLSGLVDTGVEVDYSVSTKDLYTNIASLLATQAEDATYLLNDAGLANQGSTLGLPSWVPDRSIAPRGRPMRHSTRSSPVPPAYLPVALGGTLQVRGVCLGIIESTNEMGLCPGFTRDAWMSWSSEEMCSRVSAAAEYLAGRNAEEILDTIASDLPAMYAQNYDRTILATLLYLLQNPDESHSDAQNVASLIHCFVMSGRISLDQTLQDGASTPPSTAVHPVDDVFANLFDRDRSEAVDRNALLRAAAHRFQNPTFKNSLLGEAVDTSGYALFRTTNGRSGYSVEGIKAGDVVYLAGGCGDLLVLRPFGGYMTFLAVGCIVGFGGEYIVDWDNPPGDIEVIDIK